MKILFITPRFPWPLNKGDKLRAYNQIRCLSQRHEILLFALSDERIPEEWIDQLRPFCILIKIHYLAKGKIGFRFLFGLFSTKPFQCLYHYDHQAAKALRILVDDEKPGRLFFQLLRTAVYAKEYNPNECIIDLMDCFSYHYLLRSRHSGIILNYFYRIEFIRIKNYEAGLLASFPFITIISEKDRLLLPSNPGKVLVVPNGVLCNNFSQSEKKIDLLFTGNLSYIPNVIAATFLCQKIVPLLKSNFPFLRVVLAGASPGKKISSFSDNNITILADVVNMTPLRQSARIFVAPMFLNTGIQNKILEAMAFKIPVITTPEAAEAIGAIPGKHLYTAFLPGEFVNQISEITNMTDVEIQELTKQAQNFIIKNYNWEMNCLLLEKFIN